MAFMPPSSELIDHLSRIVFATQLMTTLFDDRLPALLDQDSSRQSRGEYPGRSWKMSL